MISAMDMTARWMEHDEELIRGVRPDPQRFLPLTPAVFHIMLSLRAIGEGHGYGIMLEVELPDKRTAPISGQALCTVRFNECSSMA